MEPAAINIPSKPPLSKQQKIKMLLFGLIAVATAFGIWFYINNFLIKSKAGTDDVIVKFNPSKLAVQPGEEFTLRVRLTADAIKKISGARIVIRYDANQDKIEYVPSFTQAPNTSYFDDVIAEKTDVVNGIKRVIIDVVANKPNSELTNTTVLILKFKAKTQLGKVNFDLGGATQIVGTASNNMFTVVAPPTTIITISNTAPTNTGTQITPTVTGTLSPTPTLTPPVCQQISQECPTGLSCPAVVIGTTCGPQTQCNGTACACAEGYNNCDGSWANGCEIQGACPVPTATPGPVATVTAIPTPTPGTCNDTTPCGAGYACNGTGMCVNATTRLKLKLRFQGITDIPVGAKEMIVKIGITDGPLTEAKFQYGKFTVGAGGVWEGSVGFNAIPEKNNYALYISGPRHLQRKICDVNATDAADGLYTCTDYVRSFIPLKKGDNEFDFTNLTQMAGDTDKNGTINAEDLLFLQSNIRSTDPNVLVIGDFNHDGLIDGADYSAPIKAYDLNVKRDDE